MFAPGTARIGLGSEGPEIVGRRVELDNLGRDSGCGAFEMVVLVVLPSHRADLVRKPWKPTGEDARGKDRRLEVLGEVGTSLPALDPLRFPEGIIAREDERKS